MKTIRAIPLVLIFLLISSACCQAQEGPSSVAEAAQSAANGSFFDQVGDWFATVGKTTEDKDRILEERQLQRVQSQAGAQLATYRQAAQAGAQNAKTAVTTEIDAVKLKFKDEVAKAEAVSAAEIQAAKAKYEDLVAKSKTKATTKIEAAKARFNEEFAKLKTQAAAQAVQMKEQVQAKARQTLDQAKDKVSAQAAAYQRQIATKAAKPVERTKSRLDDLLK
jgi:F0F1-type ATP synthase membrane subunit b/b'